MNLLDYIKQNDKGLGDTVKRVVEKVGIKPCGGCKQRQEKLNQMFAYQKGEKANAAK
jgi:hypothetical protein